MNTKSKKKENNSLHSIAQFSLFVSSYLPLFLLLIVRQISLNSEYLNWTEISWESFKLFGAKFGLSAVLLFFSFVGAIGYWKTLENIEEVAKNGNPVTVTDVKNKNSESIGYIATYLIPFLFQSFDGWYECASVIFLLLIIYRIYINSSLLLINPLLSFRFGIYEIEYIDQKGKKRNGLIISRDKSLQDDCKVKLYEIGHKLYFSTTNNSN
ncbi:hypothetical protein GEO21_21510 [Sphingobacterium faecium]|uniref:hypothetical protein n=1 Tax=Sphingobacterium faecium TaxID=34087 RepID=UPI001290EEAF|nr:hypothetical protein [Sphingobacterium faecium]MQP30064.1 hypothetical protein [Sphingobacterium faecium]